MIKRVGYIFLWDIGTASCWRGIARAGDEDSPQAGHSFSRVSEIVRAIHTDKVAGASATDHHFVLAMDRERAGKTAFLGRHRVSDWALLRRSGPFHICVDVDGILGHTLHRGWRRQWCDGGRWYRCIRHGD